jgi:hypothetical protein
VSFRNESFFSSKVRYKSEGESDMTSGILLFIVGCGRSGTSLLGSMMNAHPEVAITYEAEFIRRLALRRHRYELAGSFDADAFQAELVGSRSFPALDMSETEVHAVLTPTPLDYAEAIRRLLAAYAHRRGKSFSGDKTPDGVLTMRLIADLFPEVRFLHIIRDGRAVALSLLQTEWGAKTIEDAAYYWRSRVRAGRRAGRAIGPDRYREVRYEDLVSQPDNTLSQLCRFLGLEFDTAMLRYYEHPETQQLSGLHPNLQGPPRPIRDWQQEMSRHEILFFEAIGGRLLEQLGYARLAGELPLGMRYRAARNQVVRGGRRVRKRLRSLRHRLLRRAGTPRAAAQLGRAAARKISR